MNKIESILQIIRGAVLGSLGLLLAVFFIALTVCIAWALFEFVSTKVREQPKESTDVDD